MFNQFVKKRTEKISFTEFRFDYFGYPVKWRIRESQQESDYFFTILCDHIVFQKYFPEGEAKLTGLFKRSKDANLERADRIFFQNMIDSCDIS